MSDAALERLEGVWTGTEQVRDGIHSFDATARLVFQTLFDGRFLLCEYIQKSPQRPTAFAHGVFRRDVHTNAIAVTWFRTDRAAPHEQADAGAEGDALLFVETIDGRTTRTTYRIVMDRLSVYTEHATPGGEWHRIFEGAYRRR